MGGVLCWCACDSRPPFARGPAAASPLLVLWPAASFDKVPRLTIKSRGLGPRQCTMLREQQADALAAAGRVCSPCTRFGKAVRPWLASALTRAARRLQVPRHPLVAAPPLAGGSQPASPGQRRPDPPPLGHEQHRDNMLVGSPAEGERRRRQRCATGVRGAVPYVDPPPSPPPPIVRLNGMCRRLPQWWMRLA